MRMLIGFFMLLSVNTFAGRPEFCKGWAEGYKLQKGNTVLVPLCPAKPVTPVGMTDHQLGMKMGMAKASSSGNRRRVQFHR